jgi:hypothetical protein
MEPYRRRPHTVFAEQVDEGGTFIDLESGSEFRYSPGDWRVRSGGKTWFVEEIAFNDLYESVETPVSDQKYDWHLEPDKDFNPIYRAEKRVVN